MESIFNFPTKIRFGIGTRHALKEEVQGLGSKRPFFITDSGVASLDFFEKLVTSLKGLEVGVYSKIQGNPVESQVIDASEKCRAHGADLIVAVGGGAAMDVAKVVALMATHQGKLFEYEDGRGTRSIDDGLLLPIVAIPTTAGTGSEVGRSAVISDDSTKAKKIIFSPGLLPVRVIGDPELTYGLPAHITAATGMDALTHCVETYLARGYHPICDGIAWEGIRLVSQFLVKAVKEPTNPEARSGMLMAAMMGAVAFQKGLGVTHSCAHALSTVYDLHHGLANALMIESCMEFNAEKSGDRFDLMAMAVGQRSGGSEGFLSWLRDLKKDIGIPSSLKKAGVSDIQPLIEVAFADPCHSLNPRPVSRDDFRALYTRALGEE